MQCFLRSPTVLRLSVGWPARASLHKFRTAVRTSGTPLAGGTDTGRARRERAGRGPASAGRNRLGPGCRTGTSADPRYRHDPTCSGTSGSGQFRYRKRYPQTWSPCPEQTNNHPGDSLPTWIRSGSICTFSLSEESRRSRFSFFHLLLPVTAVAAEGREVRECLRFLRHSASWSCLSILVVSRDLLRPSRLPSVPPLSGKCIRARQSVARRSSSPSVQWFHLGTLFPPFSATGLSLVHTVCLRRNRCCCCFRWWGAVSRRSWCGAGGGGGAWTARGAPREGWAGDCCLRCELTSPRKSASLHVPREDSGSETRSEEYWKHRNKTLKLSTAFYLRKLGYISLDMIAFVCPC